MVELRSDFRRRAPPLPYNSATLLIRAQGPKYQPRMHGTTQPESICRVIEYVKERFAVFVIGNSEAWALGPCASLF
jgi:hypothetical protein